MKTKKKNKTNKFKTKQNKFKTKQNKFKTKKIKIKTKNKKFNKQIAINKLYGGNNNQSNINDVNSPDKIKENIMNNPFISNIINGYSKTKTAMDNVISNITDKNKLVQTIKQINTTLRNPEVRQQLSELTKIIPVSDIIAEEAKVAMNTGSQIALNTIQEIPVVSIPVGMLRDAISIGESIKKTENLAKTSLNKIDENLEKFNEKVNKVSNLSNLSKSFGNKFNESVNKNLDKVSESMGKQLNESINKKLDNMSVSNKLQNIQENKEIKHGGNKHKYKSKIRKLK